MINLGIIGCGGHARAHIQNLPRSFHIKAIWDPNHDHLMVLRGECDLSSSLAELLARKDIDAVLIASPDQFHLSQTVNALDAGKHVFCEKPLLSEEDDIDDLQFAFELAKEKGLLLSTCHPRRYEFGILWLLQKIEVFQEDLGRVLSLSVDLSYQLPKGEVSLKPKYGTESLLFHHITHELDLMSYLFEPCGFEGWKLHDSHDLYEAVGKRDDGITFSFRLSRRLRGTWGEVKRHEALSVRFERGEVDLDITQGEVVIIDHETRERRLVEELDGYHEGRTLVALQLFGEQIEGCHAEYSPAELIMNARAGILLQKDGVQRVDL